MRLTKKSVEDISGYKPIEELVLVNNASPIIGKLGQLEDIEDALNAINPIFVIVDSIQTVFSHEAGLIPGTVQQLKYSSNELVQIQSKYYKIFCEKYEYKTSFPEIFSRYTKVLSIDEIIAKARTYKMLSYNMVYDIGRLFKSQQKEIGNIISAIDGIVLSGDYKEELSSIYSKIYNQDWLYYNAEVRLHFLKKFTDISEKEYDWKISLGGKRVDPFDVKIRELSREMVAFSQEKNKRMIAAPLSVLVKTKYFKKFENLNFSNGYSVEEFKKVKANYLKHFYRYDVLSSMSEVFYDKKENQKIGRTDIPISEMERVPTLVSLKLKLIENLTGLGNSDANVIKSLSQSLFDSDAQDFAEITTLSEEDIDYPKFTANKIEEYEDYFVYEVAGQKKIGYKVD